jgi:hypothetical protein
MRSLHALQVEPGRSYALKQAVKTALFAAGNCVGSRKNRQETILSNQQSVAAKMTNGRTWKRNQLTGVAT